MLRAIEALNRIAMALASVLMVAVFVVAALAVIFRYAIQHSLSWADESAAYLFIWIIFVGAATEVWAQGHPRVSVLVDRWPARMRSIGSRIAEGAIAVWGMLLLVWGTRAVFLEHAESWSSVPWLSLQIPYLAIPLAGALIIIFAVGRMLAPR